MLVSTLVDFHAGKKMTQAADKNYLRKLWLVASILTNLSLLGFFKYYDFIAGNLNAVTQLFLDHGSGPFPLYNIILPVGISFYTFQSMSYTIDLYRRKTRPVENLLTFACYVSMFPQLVAGPIVRFVEIEEQLRNLKSRIDFDYIRLGIFFFVCGLVKKLIFADMIAARIDPLFIQYENLQFFGSWIAVLGYTLQIYFDFSGYSDMAVGLGYMLGFKLPINFNSPYKAANISDFWDRWHITLSHWLRDYLYFGMGGSRRGRLITLRNLVITMFLGGLWHGASWTFVFWGLYHGILLVVYHTMRERGWVSNSYPLNRTVTFLAVIAGWVFFRSDTFGMAWHLLGSMTGLHGLESLVIIRYQIGLRLTGMIVFLLFWVWYMRNTWEIQFKENRALAWAFSILFIACILGLDKESPFLYFQF
ncbi:MAG: MBOAT family O-acyltransferase [Gemmatimonadota bacterium]|nr:MBOAT family O-acyltransferase [Gemmatimonadota bacterium]